MADVRKVVEFNGDNEVNMFTQELKKLSHEIPLSAAELAQIAASGGQLGIQKNKLIEFTTTVAKMAIAFDMSAEQAVILQLNLLTFMELHREDGRSW